MFPESVNGWSTLKKHQRFSLNTNTTTSPDIIRSAMSGAGVEFVSGDLRHVAINALRFDAFLIAHFVTEPGVAVWSRTRRDAKRRYAMLFISRGTMEVGGDSEHYDAPDGGITIIMPGDNPVEFIVRQPVEAVYFSFDLAEIAPMQMRVRDLRTVTPNSALFRAAYAFLRGIVTGGERDIEEDTESLRALTRAVARAMATNASPPNDWTLLEKAQHIILQEYANTKLSPDRIAARLGVSRSTLGRAFSAERLQVAREIRRTRAEKAVELLKINPVSSSRELAEGTGFGSVDSLSRALLEFYGLKYHEAKWDAQR